MKHDHLVAYRRSHTGPKCTYNRFLKRVLYHGKTWEEALTKKRMPNRPYQSKIDENGRECLICGEYKKWDRYGRENKAKTKHKATCKECSKLKRKK